MKIDLSNFDYIKETTGYTRDEILGIRDTTINPSKIMIRSKVLEYLKSNEGDMNQILNHLDCVNRNVLFNTLNNLEYEGVVSKEDKKYKLK